MLTPERRKEIADWAAQLREHMLIRTSDMNLVDCEAELTRLEERVRKLDGLLDDIFLDLGANLCTVKVMAKTAGEKGIADAAAIKLRIWKERAARP